MLRNLILTIYCAYANRKAQRAYLRSIDYSDKTIGELDDGYNDEPCGYCGDSQDPNDICLACWTKMNNHLANV